MKLCDGFYAPLVNREEAVVQVLTAFNPSETLKAAGARPVVSFAGHMYGSGKTVFGQHFAEFLAMNKEFVKQEMGRKLLPGSRTLEEGLNALCDETIYVYLDLYSFPNEGHSFKYVLYECICKDALSSNLVDKELAEGVIRLIPQRTTEWLTTLLQVTKKKYLFVFIDEIGLLGEPKRFQFNDLQSPSSNESPSAVYRMFFGLLSPLARVNRVLCVVAGRSDAIVRQKEDAMPSRVQLEFLKLDPFSLQTTDAYIRNAKYDDVPLQNIVFPHIPHGMDYLSRIVWEYTSGVPIYVRHVLSQLAKKCLSSSEWKDLSEEELREKIETIVPDSSLFVDPSRMRPETIAVFSSMLLVSVLEIPIHQEETYYGGIKLGAYSKYALDIASNFGFYYSQENTDKTFKLVYPKIVLNYLEKCHSVSSMSLYGVPVTRGIVFEILIALLLYLRLCFCSRLSMISIFRKTWVEDFEIRGDGSMRMRRYRPSYVASFSSSVSGDISSTGQTFHPSAWKAFFDTYLSKEDGIFIPVTPQSRGPDLIVRISKQAETETNNPSSTPLNKNRQEPIYVIGISLKCYRMDRGGIGRSQIKEEVEKFLIPISKDIDLEEQNVFAIQLIISTNYTEQVISNLQTTRIGGIYYEQDNRELNVRPHNAPPLRGAVSQWLSIPDRCQLVVCSTETLKTFLGSDAYKELQKKLQVDNSLPQTEKLSVLSVVLDSWLSHMPYRVSESEEKSATPEIDSFSDTNAMQVDYGRKRVVRDEPQGSSVSLKTNVHPGMDTTNAMQLKGREVAGSSSFESSLIGKLS
eukprot:jgi/Galph1/143/GphlegSOOS_G4940.1